MVIGQEQINIDDIHNHYTHILKDESLSARLRVLIDTRGADFFEGTEQQLNDLRGRIENLMERYEYIQEAIIVEEPYSTAIASLYEYHTSGISGYSFEIFSTDEGAKNWLQVN